MQFILVFLCSQKSTRMSSSRGGNVSFVRFPPMGKEEYSSIIKSVTVIIGGVQDLSVFMKTV